MKRRLQVILGGVLVISSLASAQVTIFGTTTPPGFVRKEAEFTTTFCPGQGATFESRKWCCSSALRTPDASACPTYSPTSRFIQPDDPAGCCPDPDPRPCTQELCKTPPWIFSDCSTTHNFAFDDGFKCCKFALRSSTCPTGPDTSALSPSDPIGCCHQDDFVDCAGGRCKSLSVTNCTSPVVVSHDPVYDSRFVVSHVFNDTCEDTVMPQAYLLWPSSTLNRSFVLDIGCNRPVQGVQLRNAKNRGHNDRGTKDFRLQVSEDQLNWTTLIEDQLPDARGVPCADIPLINFAFPSRTVARFFKFTTINFYGSGGGLQFFNILL